jgi:hypothetical protein
MPGDTVFHLPAICDLSLGCPYFIGETEWGQVMLRDDDIRSTPTIQSDFVTSSDRG